jgi:hypothetical protein
MLIEIKRSVIKEHAARSELLHGQWNGAARSGASCNVAKEYNVLPATVNSWKKSIRSSEQQGERKRGPGTRWK